MFRCLGRRSHGETSYTAEYVNVAQKNGIFKEYPGTAMISRSVNRVINRTPIHLGPAVLLCDLNLQERTYQRQGSRPAAVS